MHDILPSKQARARGIIRTLPRPQTVQAVSRPADAYQQVYRRVETPVDEPVTEEITVTTVTTTISSPMIKAIEHLSEDEKADALRRARLQAEGAVTMQRGSLLSAPAFDTLSVITKTVSKTVTRVASTTKKHLPKVKKLPIVNQPLIQRYGLYGLAAVMVLVTGYVSIDTLITNSRVREQTQITTGSDVAGASDSNGLAPTDASQEGKDEADISAQLISQYSVAPDMPRVLSIPSINVKARVIPMSLNADRSVQSPVNIFDSGWYDGSAKPGEDGTAFIDGHASGATRMGLFAYLDQLENGDEVKIEKGDGSTLTYRVVHKEVLPLKNLNMNKVLSPHGDAQKALNIMTCTGDWIEEKQTYDHRVVIYTEQVS